MPRVVLIRSPEVLCSRYMSPGPTRQKFPLLKKKRLFFLPKSTENVSTTLSYFDWSFSNSTLVSVTVKFRNSLCPWWNVIIPTLTQLFWGVALDFLLAWRTVRRFHNSNNRNYLRSWWWRPHLFSMLWSCKWHGIFQTKGLKGLKGFYYVETVSLMLVFKRKPVCLSPDTKLTISSWAPFNGFGWKKLMKKLSMAGLYPF